MADLNAIQPLGAVVVLPGATWNFQCWYRDTALGFLTSNFSDGLEVRFTEAAATRFRGWCRSCQGRS
ncbi:MAG: hypothetical protein R3F49_24985 [Planctomycetota bacterium]